MDEHFALFSSGIIKDFLFLTGIQLSVEKTISSLEWNGSIIRSQHQSILFWFCKFQSENKG